MTTRIPGPVWMAARAFALLLLLAVPVRAAAQGQRPAAAPAVSVKDLPLTAAQRGTYEGSYSVTLPQGGQTVLRVFEEDGVLIGVRMQ